MGRYAEFVLRSAPMGPAKTFKMRWSLNAEFTPAFFIIYRKKLLHEEYH